MRFVLPWLLLASLASAEPQFEYSLSEALRHPDQVRALRFNSYDWPAEPGYIQCLGFVGLDWPKVLERFHNLEVLEVTDTTGGVFSLWTGPCPLPKLRRLSFQGAALGLWSNHYDLGNISELELRNCQAHLGMPNQRCSLQVDHLEKLDLSFSGLDQVQFVGCHLRSLNLAYRSKHSVPAWVWDQKVLQELNLSGNELKHLPAQFNNLTQLRSLQLADNSLDRVDLSPFPQLQDLNLAGNPMTQAPDVSGLPMRSLDLSVCQLQQLPSLPNGLLKLNAARNHIGELPAILPSSLQEIDLSWNQIKKCEAVGGLAQLRVLDLSHNQLATCPSLGPLQSLNLGFNQLQQWPSVASVEKLNLAHNLLTEAETAPPGVRELDLAQNSLREIPRNSSQIVNLSLNPLALSTGQDGERQLEGLQAEADSRPDPFGREEYQILNALTRSGRLQRRTINAYSPMGLAADKRARFWKAAEFLKIEPDLLRSYALNNAQQYGIDPAQVNRPLLNSVTSDPDLLWQLADQENIVGLSRVGFSSDRLHALVYAQSLDTMTQGSGMLVQLTRRGQSWVVVSSEALWLRMP